LLSLIQKLIFRNCSASQRAFQHQGCLSSYDFLTVINEFCTFLEQIIKNIRLNGMISKLFSRRLEINQKLTMWRLRCTEKIGLW
jgi:hypothetical protein